jgi:hypothetical protein
MGWLESRIQIAEQRIESLYRRLQDLLAQLNGVRQQLRMAFASGGEGGGGGSGGAFVCMAPSSGTYAGTWSGSAPTAGAAFTATVYQVSYAAAGPTTTITSLGSQAVVNWLPATLVNSKACVVIPDGAGSYGVVSQSCT